MKEKLRVMNARRLVPALTLAGISVLTVAGVGHADAPKSPTPASPASAPGPGKTETGHAGPALATKAPRGYLVVRSGSLLAVSGQQTRGVVTCPAGLVPLGGGVSIVSLSTLANVNSSFPRDNGWVADVNNASGASTTFEVRVVCARAPKHYQVVIGNGVSNPSATQRSATVDCPTGTKPLGGGGLSNAGLTFVNMNTDAPSGRGWRVDENNATGFDAIVTAFAVCGKIRGYELVTGTTQTISANTQGLAFADCPALKVPIGGGVFSNSSSLGVNINTTNTEDPVSEWESFINNASGIDTTATPFAVCAGG
jgi:hypothetical protein